MCRKTFVVLLTALAFHASAQTMPMGLTGTTMLIAFKEVKKEIQLTKEQDKQIQAMNEQLQKNPEMHGMLDLHYMTRSMDEKLATILNETQNVRMKELFWQYNGLFALTEKDLCEKLSLSDEQQGQAKTLIKAYDKALMDHLMTSKGKFDKKLMDGLRTKATEDLAAVLNPEQTEAWKTAQGKPFKFPKLGR